MQKKMTIEEMIKLEKLLCMENKGNLTEDEKNYLNKATKVPYMCLMKDLIYYQKNCLLIDKVFYIDYLKKKYMVSEEEIEKRIMEVQRIYKYHQKGLNNQVKEQKRMVKKMNNY